MNSHTRAALSHKHPQPEHLLQFLYSAILDCISAQRQSSDLDNQRRKTTSGKKKRATAKRKIPQELEIDAITYDYIKRISSNW